MSAERTLRVDGERGAALILVIAFLLVVGGITSAVVTSVTSGLSDRSVLDQARNRQYAADGAIEKSIARVRGLTAPGVDPCGTDPFFQLNGFNIHVDCANAATVLIGSTGSLLSQSDVIFTACLKTGGGANGVPCTPTTTIISAQVNFQGSGASAITWVQAWSVNG